MITKTISHYEILAPIGEGGMGVVYRAVDTRLGRPVAVKLLRRDGAIDGESRKRFVQEARAASALNHPHIITIYDIGQDAGRRLHRDGVRRRPVAGPRDRTEQAAARGGAAVRRADRGRAGGRARRRNPPSRPQAGQHHGQRQGIDQGSRFRAREADRVRRLQADRRARRDGDRGAAGADCRPRKGRFSARPPTCRPNRPRGNRRMRDRMSSRSVRCSTK